MYLTENVFITLTARSLNKDIHIISRITNDSTRTKLTKAGANINLQNNWGVTALIYASIEGHIECIKVLISSGANPNLHCINHETALISASHKGHIECVKILIRSGANINLQTYDGETALDIAIRKGNSERVEVLKDFRDKAARIIQKYVLMYIYHPSNIDFILQNRKGKW